MEATESTGGNSSPTTFAEAFAADTSPVSDPSSQSTTPPAAEQPGTEAQALPQQTEDERSPFIPRPRFDEINTRLKDAEAALSEWKQHEWAKQVSQQEFQQIAEMARKATADPIAYVQDFIKTLQADPTYNAQLKSLAARALSQRQAAPANTEPQLETFPVDLGDGRIVQLATADSLQKREAWLQQQWLAQAEQKFQPYTQTLEQMQAEKAALAKQQQVAQYVETTFNDVKTWPGMDDPANQKAVSEELKRARIDEDDAREISLALNAAYRKVVLPKLASKSESSLLENLQRKAAAATSINPGSTASTSSRPVNSFKDLPADAWR